MCLTKRYGKMAFWFEGMVDSAQFRYVVWNYTSQKARPIVYGVGHHKRLANAGSRLQVQSA